MPRPKNKKELIEAATTNYEKLMTMIENRTDAEKNASSYYDWAMKKMKAHKKNIGVK